MGDPMLPMRLDSHLSEQVVNRPSLIDYNPVANASAMVIASDNMARCVPRAHGAPDAHARTLCHNLHHHTSMASPRLPAPRFAPAGSPS